MHKNYTSKGIDEVYMNKPSRFRVNSQMVYNSDGRSINKENPRVNDFLGGDKFGVLTHISSQHSARILRISFNYKHRQLNPPNMDKKYVMLLWIM